MSESGAPALRLVISLDDTVRKIHPLSGAEIVIGRGAECDLVLEDSTVSRKHARVYMKSGRLMVEDLGSTHGVFVGGKRTDRAPLQHGDRFEIGPFLITLDDAREVEENQQTGHVALQRQPPSAKELDILLSIVASLGEEQRPAVLERLLLALLRTMQAARALLYRWDSRRASPHLELAIAAEGAVRDGPVSESLLKKVAKEKEPYLATDLAQAAGEAPSVERLHAEHVQSVIVAPLKLGRRLVGLLYLDSPAARRSFTSGDLDLLGRASSYLAGTLDNMVVRSELSAENQRLRALAGGKAEIPIDKLVAPGSPMEPVIQQLTLAAGRDVTVLLTGETGTGKEVAARALHRMSSRAEARFIAVNCGAIPESLIESELFGHRKGAFTGANEDRAGLVEMADKGTLFLDEVAELPIGAQVRLLRVLEERQVTRLGSTDPVNVDFRLVAATHRDLAAKVADGTFRQDLVYRLKVFEIKLPALRERIADLPLLVDYLIESLATRAGSNVSDAAPDLLPALRAYDWPGNIRELRNALERALVVERSDRLTAAGLPAEVRAGATREVQRDVREARPTGKIRIKGDEAGGVRKWADVVKDLERAYLADLMQQVGGNITAMARVSGLSRLTLYRRLGQLGLETPGGPPPGDDE